MSTFDGQALVKGLYANKANLDKQAHKAGFIGGIQVAGFGIPNQFLGLDLRTANQRDAQEAPNRFMDAMQSFLRTLNEALDAAARINHS
jgi:hypothetical protein